MLLAPGFFFCFFFFFFLFLVMDVLGNILIFPFLFIFICFSLVLSRVGVGMTPHSIFLACQKTTTTTTNNNEPPTKQQDVLVYKFKREKRFEIEQEQEQKKSEGVLIKTIEGAVLKAVMPFVSEKEGGREWEEEEEKGLRVVYLPSQQSPQYTAMDIFAPPTLTSTTTTPPTTSSLAKEGVILSEEQVLEDMGVIMAPMTGGKRELSGEKGRAKGSILFRYVAEKYVTQLVEAVTISGSPKSSSSSSSSSSPSSSSSSSPLSPSSFSSPSLLNPKEKKRDVMTSFYIIFFAVIILCGVGLYGCSLYSHSPTPRTSAPSRLNRV